MEYTAGTSWLHPQHISELHDARTTTNDDWKDPSSSMSAAAAGPPGTQQSMDMSEFVLESIPATSSNPPITSSTSTYFNFPSHTNYFLSGDPVPAYNPAPPYRSWSSAPSTIPLSNYSSLNGATSVSQNGSGQSHQSLSSPPQMMIDPQLTVNSPPANGQQHYPVSYISPQPLQPQRAHYSYQHSSHSPTTTIAPSFVHTTAAHFQQQQYQRQPSQQPIQPQQQQQPPQHSSTPIQHHSPPGTLSPYVLHSPPSSVPQPPAGLATTSAPIVMTHMYTSPPPPSLHSSGPTLEQLKEEFLNNIRPLLQQNSFSGAGAVKTLTNFIKDYGISKVDLSTRTDILTKIRDNAGNHYFRAWQENDIAMEITRAWLKEGADSDSPFSATTMPLLHILDRLPMTIHCLKTSLIAKELKPFKSSSSAAIQDMASNLTRKWRALLPQSQTKPPAPDGSSEDARAKKRKAEELASTLKAASAKKPAVVSSAKPASAVKKEASKAQSAVKEATTAKSDSSFFSAPKPKKPLPSFKKSPATKKEPDPNVAQPSSYDPFLDIVKSMKTRKDSPSTATPPPATSVLTPSVAPSTLPRQSSDSSNADKKKKTVTWAPDNQLESVKLIERAVYDDDPVDGMQTAHSVRDLDRSEGAALIAHMFDEQVDWSELLLVEMPMDIDIPPRGRDSMERMKQEEREQSALGALYLNPSEIPDSPHEPDSQIPDEHVDTEAKIMLTGPEVDAVFWSGGMPAALAMEPPPSSASVAELVGQLSAGSTDVPMGNTAQTFNFDPAVLGKIGPDQLQQLVQHTQALQNSSIYPAGQSAAHVPRGNGEPDWNSSSYPDYDRGYDDTGRRWSGDDTWNNERGGTRGRGLNRGRGRGRGDMAAFGRGGGGFKRKPCTFFAQGRCKYGDKCDFSHELGAPGF